MTTGTVVRISKSSGCRLLWKRVCADVSLPVLSEVFAGLKSPSILGGGPAELHGDGCSYWAAEPKEILELVPGRGDPFEKLHRALTKYKLEDPAIRPSGSSINCGAKYLENPAIGPSGSSINCGAKYVAPRFIWGLPKEIFCGGWVGYFSYELGRHIERIPPAAKDDLKMPLLRLCFYDKVIAYDHARECFWLISLELPGDSEDPEKKIAYLEELLAQAQDVCVAAPKAYSLDEIDFARLRCNMSKDYYLGAVEQIKRHIRDGDVYQVNFSQRFDCDYSGRPISLYHCLNRYNPSGYSAYIDGGDCSVVGASPEMFMEIRGGHIRTRPIKGTRPRLPEGAGANPQTAQVNARYFDELLHSGKEQAELNMIVDLERNDLAKVCRPGTRGVTQPRTIETHPTLFHAAATVAGELREDVTFCDVIKAMFPGGSITGAPKIRAMELIAETEPTARGVYTGSIGFVGVDGSVCLNIAIRTVIIKGNRAYVQAGGGIVADSEAEAEYDETIAKARALLAGIKATQNNRL